mmetsp:Transcript_13887/g.31783  ORF Transcript_13887/g.31783 Transcript_13887/m.31783 type:complete len:87 (-) Transcript_13887:6-266(-)|eukprot:CAMPEP_0119396382 /NCGR_PEP_ID=MMETSP1334-20130426/136818_1 /TAXON_ID=127549 /ORGANISM="Calcidiscus leptoporus, Strain RCC1130" /LENGTH=86 /DNA_ID=CAMNT_0007420045 /DNA_START=83 /DNA_END=343 /DNA_ORIENTATION=+
MGGCCSSAGDAHDPSPMSGSDTVGKVQGNAVNREEARERAAAAADARAKAGAQRGQQGTASKMKQQSQPVQPTRGKPDLANPATWD